MKKSLFFLMIVSLFLFAVGCSGGQDLTTEEDVYVPADESVSSSDLEVSASSSDLNVSEETDSVEMNGPLKMGRYEGFWTGEVADAYGYITLNADGTCYIETNIDQSGNYITPVAEYGTYELFESEEFFPDGTSVMQTMITLYIDGDNFATYVCNPDYDRFEDQWSGYEYVGK